MYTHTSARTHTLVQFFLLARSRSHTWRICSLSLTLPPTYSPITTHNEVTVVQAKHIARHGQKNHAPSHLEPFHPETAIISNFINGVNPRAAWNCNFAMACNCLAAVYSFRSCMTFAPATAPDAAPMPTTTGNHITRIAAFVRICILMTYLAFCSCISIWALLLRRHVAKFAIPSVVTFALSCGV